MSHFITFVLLILFISIGLRLMLNVREQFVPTSFFPTREELERAKQQEENARESARLEKEYAQISERTKEEEEKKKEAEKLKNALTWRDRKLREMYDRMNIDPSFNMPIPEGYFDEKQKIL